MQHARLRLDGLKGRLALETLAQMGDETVVQFDQIEPVGRPQPADQRRGDRPGAGPDLENTRAVRRWRVIFADKAGQRSGPAPGRSERWLRWCDNAGETRRKRRDSRSTIRP